MNSLCDVALFRSAPTYHTAVSTAKPELVEARPLHLAYARPFGRLKAPLGFHCSASLRKREQRSFCSAQIIASFGVKLAYGVKIAGNHCKQKAETSRFVKKFQALFCLNWSLSGQGPPSCWRKTARPLKSPPLGLSLLRKRGIYCSIGFIVGSWCRYFSPCICQAPSFINME